MGSSSQLLDRAIDHHQAGRLSEAEQIYRQVLESDPREHDALHLLGVVAHQRGRHDEAMSSIRRSLAVDGSQAKIHNSLGAVHHALGRLPEAVACFRQSIMLDMNYPEGHNNLGLALLDQRRPAEAVPPLERAVLLKPDYATAHNNLGLALAALGRDAEAVACYERALQLRADLWQAHANLGSLRQRLGQMDEAVACFTEAHRFVMQSPAVPQAQKPLASLLLMMHYRTGVTLQELAAAHAEFDRAFGADVRKEWVPHDNDRDPERRLKVGLVSPSLHAHPVGFFVVGLLEHLDPEQVEVACYDTSGSADDLTARIRAKAAIWRGVSAWDDERLAGQIRADGIDILFDLAGHREGNRLMVFARKPAPIQVTWGDYPGTTGLSAIDYILADRQQVPPGAERHYGERVLRMPDAYVCYAPPAYAPPVSPLPALEQRHVTFGSFNNPAKLNAGVVKAWSRILGRVSGSRLVLKYHRMDDPVLAGHLRESFKGHGIDPGRLTFLGASPHAQLLECYGDIDVALDPFPYNGGLTTLESLWMGVPVVTCPGETFAGRHSLTYLSAIGLVGTIAGDLDEYVDVAVALAGDLPALADLRADLRGRVAASPLCDGERFAGHFQRLLRGIWRDWAAP
jgi:predicted O-linked N-acetylglucosamine transferase (SPINDLY family)